MARTAAEWARARGGALGREDGRTVAALAMIANLAVVISSSWLLLLGVREDESALS